MIGICCSSAKFLRFWINNKAWELHCVFGGHSGASCAFRHANGIRGTCRRKERWNNTPKKKSPASETQGSINQGSNRCISSMPPVGVGRRKEQCALCQIVVGECIIKIQATNALINRTRRHCIIGTFDRVNDAFFHVNGPELPPSKGPLLQHFHQLLPRRA
jgi:hypothetical protein